MSIYRENSTLYEITCHITWLFMAECKSYAVNNLVASGILKDSVEGNVFIMCLPSLDGG
jgi:hypothetical protein